MFRVSPSATGECDGCVPEFHFHLARRERPEDYQPQSRISQPTTMTVAMPAMISATRGPFGTHSSHRPIAADTSNQGPTTTQSTANIVPPAFARKASSQQPRTTQANAVVDPQLGQGRPKSISNEQGGKPNCWCVPYPRSLGCKNNAMTSGHKKPTPSKAAIQRSRPKSCRFKGGSVCVTSQSTE